MMQVTPMWMPIMMPVVDVLPCSSFTQSHGVSNTEEIQHNSQSQRHHSSTAKNQLSARPSPSKDDTRLTSGALRCRTVCSYSMCGCVWLCQIITRFLHRLSKRNKAQGRVAISVLVVCKQLDLIDQCRIWTKRKDRVTHSDNE